MDGRGLLPRGSPPSGPPRRWNRPGCGGNREKWRRLPAAQQAELQAALEPTLSMLGYETSGASQPAPRWKAACYRLEALAQQRRAALGMPAIKLRWWAWRARQLQRPPIQEGAPDFLQKPMG